MIILSALWILAVLAQADYWLWHRGETARMDEAVWRACVRPGE